MQCLQGRTRVTHRRHNGPLLVQRAFYPERNPGAAAATGEPCHLYIIHPPGGVAGGDHLELDARVGPAAHALLTTPAAGKFYRRGTGGTARLHQSLHVEDGILEWLPQENIFYPDAAVEVASIVRLSAGARFFGWEIGCLGLPARGETLQSGEVRQSFELWRDGHPLLLEHVAIEPACLSARWGMAGYAALGTCIGYPAAAPELAIARAQADACAAAYGSAMTVACTLVDDVLVCRARASRADQLKRVFVELWRAARAAFAGREAVPPRIWAT